MHRNVRRSRGLLGRSRSGGAVVSGILRRQRFAGLSVPRRPRAVWAAFVTGLVVSVLVVLGVLIPILTLIGGAVGVTAGTLRVPVGPIVLAVAVGYVLAIVLLVLCLRSRFGALSWVLSVAAVISTLAVSLWPIVAVALAGVQQVQDVIPFIQQLIAKVTGG